MGRRNVASMARIAWMTATLDCWSPWLMLMRNASAPAWNSVSIISGLLEAGPSVARTRTLRDRGLMALVMGINGPRLVRGSV